MCVASSRCAHPPHPAEASSRPPGQKEQLALLVTLTGQYLSTPVQDPTKVSLVSLGLGVTPQA